MSEESPPTAPRGWGGNKALHPFQIWKASSTKSSLFNCPIYCTVEQVIIRAYLLIFERVSLTSLSLRCDFLGVQRDFSRLRLDFNYVFSRSSLEVRLHFSTFKPIREGAAPLDQVLLQSLFCGSCFRRCRASSLIGKFRALYPSYKTGDPNYKNGNSFYKTTPESYKRGHLFYKTAV